MSQDEITAVSHSTGLSSKVKDFFTDVLEDAMTRSAAVAQITLRSPNETFSDGRTPHELRGTIGHNAYVLISGVSSIDSLPLVESIFARQMAQTSGFCSLGP